MKISKKDLKKIINEEIDKFKKNEENLEEAWYDKFTQKGWEKKAEETRGEKPKDPVLSLISFALVEPTLDTKELEELTNLLKTEKEGNGLLGKLGYIMMRAGAGNIEGADPSKKIRPIRLKNRNIFILGQKLIEISKYGEQLYFQMAGDIWSAEAEKHSKQKPSDYKKQDDERIKMADMRRKARRAGRDYSSSQISGLGQQISENYELEKLVNKQVKNILGK